MQQSDNVFLTTVGDKYLERMIFWGNEKGSCEDDINSMIGLTCRTIELLRLEVTDLKEKQDHEVESIYSYYEAYTTLWQ